MYPPPGSYRYSTPQPSRSDVPIPFDNEIDCNTLKLCLLWCKASFLFKTRFWTLMFMLMTVISTGHFSSLMLFPRNKQSLFTIKNYNVKLNSIRSPLEEQNHHRKMKNLIPKSTSNNNSKLSIFSYKSSEISKNSLTQADKIIASTINAGTKVGNKSKSNAPHLADKLSTKVNNGNIFHKKQIRGSKEKAVEEVIAKLCPPVPPNLVGPSKVILNSIISIEVQENSAQNLMPGGRYRPTECRSRNKVVIIIPYRDRTAHLAVFLYNIHPFLQRQQLDYSILIVEQADTGSFNRAMLMNIGSIEALKLYPYDCFIFHDVDLIPEDDRNLYTCPQQPRHMSVAINTFKYRLPYNDIFGGVSAMTVNQFKTVNGFSNKFWGWGGEDDDMSNRIKYYGFYISRYPANVARYTMITHKKDRPNPHRYKYLNDGRRRFQKDGLNSVKYKVKEMELKPLYTWIKVELSKV